MKEVYKAYVTLVLTQGFDAKVYKNIFKYFVTTFSHGISKYLREMLL